MSCKHHCIRPSDDFDNCKEHDRVWRGQAERVQTGQRGQLGAKGENGREP